MFTRTIAPILIIAKNLIGDNLLNFSMRNLVTIDPTKHPSGIIPIRIDRAVDDVIYI